MSLTFGSLFAGIGGLDIGLERAGMQCAWQVEIDDYATRVLERHWPNVARFRDVRDCGAGNLGPVDLICGGFPCQDVSFAGKRAGLGGERSTLWSEFARIVDEIKPRWVLAENVAGLLSANDGQFFGTVLRDLATIGYDAEWDCIPAAAVGAPHCRWRVFVVANANGGGLEVRTQLDSQAQQDSSDGDPCGQYPDRRRNHVADAAGRGAERSGAWRDVGRFQEEILCTGRYSDYWAVEPDVGRVADGVPSRVDRLRCLGNAVVPQVAEWVGRRIVEAGG